MTDTKVRIICKDCGGNGYRSGGIPPQQTDECADCQGTGYIGFGQLDIDLEDRLGRLPTVSQLNTKFQELETDIDLIKSGLQSIWNKVKDL